MLEGEVLIQKQSMENSNLKFYKNFQIVAFLFSIWFKSINYKLWNKNLRRIFKSYKIYILKSQLKQMYYKYLLDIFDL